MWLSKRLSEERPDDSIIRGRVTSGGTLSAVASGRGELRGVETFSPAGLRWTPKGGSDILVIKTQDGPVALGVSRESDCDAVSLAVGANTVTVSRLGVAMQSGDAVLTLNGGGITLKLGGATLAVMPNGIFANGKQVKTED